MPTRSKVGLPAPSGMGVPRRDHGDAAREPGRRRRVDLPTDEVYLDERKDEEEREWPAAPARVIDVR